MEIKPTESEMEILQILWERGLSTVREVNEQLSRNKDKQVGYTTTLKLMQIMHDKGLVERETEQRSHRYRALVSKEATRKNLLRRFIDTIFNGSSADLVMEALGNERSSDEELDKIREYLKDLDQKK